MTPGQPDPVVVRRHLLAIDDALQILRRHQEASPAELAADRERRWAVERGLQLCAQNALDIATHIAASLGHDVADYAAAIDRLADLEILPRAFAATFRGVAGFRNVIVHGYLDIDLAIVERLLRTGLDDFAIFARHVHKFLESHNPD
jgi:uncharacterized protein YutE (UPF0331/DUF86 family)